MRMQFSQAYLGGQWIDGRQLDIRSDRIEPVPAGGETPGLGPSGDLAIGGLVNAHSHAFQRAMAGLAESRTGERDSFWTWRNVMYGFLQKLNPDDVYQIAKHVYGEMLLAGYTTVAEFHYLHNDPLGTPYQQRTCMSDVLVRAAQETGIDICLLPVLYQHGGFDKRLLEGPQRRFFLSTDSFLELIDQLCAQWSDTPGVDIGVAFHSLRAVSIQTIRSVLDALPRRAAGCPLHIHAAEQRDEVEACVVATGRRPIELLLDEWEMDSRWCVIHATHLTDEECRRLAHSGAVVGACPTTEANLGDGVFRAVDFLKHGGKLAIGSDSHVAVDPFGELRLLEYAARWNGHSRAVLADPDRSCGRTLYDWTYRGGQQAIGQPLAPGNSWPSSLIVLDGEHPNLLARRGDRILDSLVFAQHGLPIRDVMVRGHWRVQQGRLVNNSNEEYRRCLRRLLS